MKKKVIRICSVVGIVLSLSVLLACGPVGRTLLIHGAAAAVSRGVENTVDENTTYTATCPHCGARVSWQGRATLVRCGNCQNQFTVDPKD